MPFGIPYRWLAEAGSTNDVAREWAISGAPEGALVVAARQTRGRGRRERQWSSPAGQGLYASIVLRPDWPAPEAPNLAILGGVAAYRALEQAGVEQLRIKWPNDVLANGRKICGVLVEPRIGGGRIEFAVVGIGINVGQLAEDFSSDVRGIATSCRIEGAGITVEQMQVGLMEAMEAARSMSMSALRAEWIAAGAREEVPEI